MSDSEPKLDMSDSEPKLDMFDSDSNENKSLTVTLIVSEPGLRSGEPPAIRFPLSDHPLFIFTLQIFSHVCKEVY